MQVCWSSRSRIGRPVRKEKGRFSSDHLEPELSSSIKHMLRASQTGDNVMLKVSCRLRVVDDALWRAAPGSQTLQK